MPIKELAYLGQIYDAPYGVLVADDHLTALSAAPPHATRAKTAQQAPSQSAPAAMKELLEGWGIFPEQTYALYLCLPSELEALKQRLTDDGRDLFAKHMATARLRAYDAETAAQVALAERRRAVIGRLAADGAAGEAHAAHVALRVPTGDVAQAAAAVPPPAVSQNRGKASKIPRATTTTTAQYPPLDLALKSAAGGGPAPAPAPQSAPQSAPQPAPQTTPRPRPKPSATAKKRTPVSSDVSSEDESSSMASLTSRSSSSSSSDSDDSTPPPVKATPGKREKQAAALVDQLSADRDLNMGLFTLPSNHWQRCTMTPGRVVVGPGHAVLVVTMKAKPGKLSKLVVTALSGAYGAPRSTAFSGFGDPALFYPFPADMRQFASTQKYLRNLLVSRSAAGDSAFVSAQPGEVEKTRQHLADFNEQFQLGLTQVMGDTNGPWGSATQPHPHPCSVSAWCAIMHLYLEVLTAAIAVKKDPAQLIPLLREAWVLAANHGWFTRDPAEICPQRLQSMLAALGVHCGNGHWGWLSTFCPHCGVNTVSAAKSGGSGEQYVRTSAERATALAAFKSDPKHPDRAKMAPKELNQAFNRDAASTPFKEKKTSVAKRSSAGTLTESDALHLLPKIQNRLSKPVVTFPITYK